ncbi:MAG: tetratricopeptide repeat protein [Chitinophagaceae bacterium]|nr:tetratricopeptide repeat protein [Chitinophagaceae bacterium]
MAKYYIPGIVTAITILLFACNGNTDKSTNASGKTAELILLEKQVASRPDSIGLRYQLMNELLKNNLYEAAIMQNDTLLKGDSANAVFWYRRGAIQLQKGDTATAITSMQTAVQKEPMFMEPLLDIASVYASQSDSNAITVTNKVIQITPDPKLKSEAKFIQGLYYSNINNKAKALASFDECIKNDYTFLDAYVEKGLLLYDSKDYKAALAVFEQTIQVSNTFAEGYYNAGRCEEALGNKEEAKLYYNKAHGLDKSLSKPE